MKRINISASVIALSLLTFQFSSCNDFLDTMPDNRAEIDSELKVKTLLTSAYPTNSYVFLTEVMSDNVDDIGEESPYTDRFFDEVYAWKDLTETNNDDTERFWNASYRAIAAANHALEAIDKMGGPRTSTLRECKGEALLCRAYNHFMLVNIFCKNYNATTSTKDLGIPYATKSETSLFPKYDRGTVAEDYKLIEKDLLEALPLVGDAHLSVPKYHFNTQAAYAFACRFYLYYEQWDKAIEYANLCLGSNPQSMLRDWEHVGSMPQGDAGRQAIEEHYISADLNCNLLLATSYSSIGLVFNPYYAYSRYAHSSYLAENETGNAKNIWGESVDAHGKSVYYSRMAKYSATNLDMTIFWKYPALFEITDPIAQVGFRRAVNTLFTADECLLNRAEAYTMKKEYDKAAADLSMWAANILKDDPTYTPNDIMTFYNSVGYSYDDADKKKSTVKKHLHPSFTIDAERSQQETMLQCVLGFRRIETLHGGMRWFDIKRYGIEIPRRLLNESGQPSKITDLLTKDDERRAIQIPMKVIQAGLTPNPRK